MQRWNGSSSTEKCCHFPDSIYSNLFFHHNNKVIDNNYPEFSVPAIWANSDAITENNARRCFWPLNVIWTCCYTRSDISAHLCLSMCLSIPGMAASHSTRRDRSTMALWLLGCGAPDTPLIIYLACVYLCWTRLSEGGSREGKADAILPARVRAAQNSGGTAGFVETRVLVYGRARLGDSGGNNAAMPTGVMVCLAHKHTI